MKWFTKYIESIVEQKIEKRLHLLVEDLQQKNERRLDTIEEDLHKWLENQRLAYRDDQMKHLLRMDEHHHILTGYLDGFNKILKEKN